MGGLAEFLRRRLKVRGAGCLDRLGFPASVDLLHLIANNSRFLILPDRHYPNLASRVLALCERRLVWDWQARFGYPLLLLETFVDPRHFHGTLYRAANWQYVGDTRGFRRTRAGYSPLPAAAKWVFLRPLHPKAQAYLSRSRLDPAYAHGAPTLMLSAEHMRALLRIFRRHPRPAPRPGAPSPLTRRVGHCRRRHLVRDARLQSHQPVG